MEKSSQIFAENVVTQAILSFKSFTPHGQNITWNIKVKFTLTMFNSIYISRFKKLHEKPIDRNIYSPNVETNLAKRNKKR